MRLCYGTAQGDGGNRFLVKAEKTGMIEGVERLRALQRRWERSAYGTMSYAEALERFQALWMEARALQDDLGRDWMDDLAPDLAIARAVNGLPPS